MLFIAQIGVQSASKKYSDLARETFFVVQLKTAATLTLKPFFHAVLKKSPSPGDAQAKRYSKKSRHKRQSRVKSDQPQGTHHSKNKSLFIKNYYTRTI